MRENTDQNYSEYELFLRSVCSLKTSIIDVRHSSKNTSCCTSFDIHYFLRCHLPSAGEYLIVSPWSINNHRNNRPEVFFRKGVLKIYSKYTEENPRRNAISIKLRSNFIEIALWHGCSSVNLLYIFSTLFPKNTFGRLLL